VDGHSGRLVYCDYVFVFMENLERDRFRFGAEWRTFSRFENDALASAKILGTF
jgi:hypothetical protein